MADPLSKISEPLRKRIDKDETALHNIVIDLDTSVGLSTAFERVNGLVQEALKEGGRSGQHLLSRAGDDSPSVRARLQGKVIEALAALDAAAEQSVIDVIRRDVDDGRSFNPDNLIRSVISIPMLEEIDNDEDALRSVLIEVNANYGLGRPKAKERVRELIQQVIGPTNAHEFISDWKSSTSEQYVYAKLTGASIRKLVELDQKATRPAGVTAPEGAEWCAIYHIWPDFKVRAQVWKSVSTVKADACRRAFATTGKGIVWAVFDSGIDGSHPQFELHDNLDLPSGLNHMDFTGAAPAPVAKGALTDDYGHGTHVAGIIAGELDSSYKAISLARERDQNGAISYTRRVVDSTVMGVAPECKLVSYRVLDENGEGDVSTIIAAIQKVQELNGYGRQILIHGVNMSLGYDFDPEWFACGQSPVCVEVDRLVRSGVAVVIAAGNTGKGFALTINDPGNAELAVTVGATHRDMPHRYGVSYFSSKGPTGDGRRKPDLLAPGERIISCGAGPDLKTFRAKAGPEPADAGKVAYYLERSGTSMAAPHVSGIIAGILSTRGEFIGLPEDMKDLLVKNATDLGRDRNFQGGGLVDMMRTIQAI